MIHRPLVIAVLLTAVAFAAVATTVTLASPLNSGQNNAAIADSLAPLAAEAASAAKPAAEKFFLTDKFAILGELPKKAVLAARRLMLATQPATNANVSVTTETNSAAAPNNAIADNAAPTVAGDAGGTESGATATAAAAPTTDATKAAAESSTGIGQAFSDFFRLAWAKAQPLLSQGWNSFAALLAGFFAGLWTPAANTNAAMDTVVNVNAAVTTPADTAPTTSNN